MSGFWTTLKQRSSLLQLCVALMLCGTPVAGVLAQPPISTAPTSNPVRMDVPANRPETWPRAAHPWVPMPRSQFEQRWQQFGSGREEQPQISISEAQYTATLTGTTLTGGQARLAISNAANRPFQLVINSFTLAMNRWDWVTPQPKPRISERPLPGTTALGDLQLIVPPGEQELRGQWTLAGETYGDVVDFELGLPSAESSVVTLDLPSDRVLTSSIGVVTSNQEHADRRKWSVFLGTQNRTRISIRPADDNAEEPRLLFETDSTSQVRLDELRFQSLIQIEAVGGPVSLLTILVPTTADVYSVLIGDQPAIWTSETETGSARVVVKLPEPMSGRLRPIRIDGLMLIRSGQPVALPRFALVNGIFQTGSHTYSVQAPLQVQAIRSAGYRQLSPESPKVDGDSTTCQQLQADGFLVLDVRRPVAAQSVQSLSVLEPSEFESWRLTTELLWTSRSGSTFQLGLMIPAGWEVTNVETTGPNGSTDVASWDATVQDSGVSLLSVELLEAIGTGQPRPIRLTMRHPVIRQGERFAIPIPSPVGVDTADQTLVVLGEAANRIDVQDEPLLTVTSAERVSQEIQATSTWTQLIEPQRQTAQFLRSTWTESADQSRHCRMEDSSKELPADVFVSVSLEDQQLRQEVAVAFLQGERSVKLLLPSEFQGAKWTIREPATQQSLTARRTAEPVAAPLTGQWWELSLNEPAATSLIAETRMVVSGIGSQTFSLPHLAAAPEHSEERRRVQQLLRVRLPAEWETATRHLTPLPPDEALGQAGGSWYSYGAENASLTITPLTTVDLLALTQRPRFRVLLRSLVAGAEQADDLHEAEYELLAGNPQFVELKLLAPATILRATWNEEPIRPQAIQPDQWRLTGTTDRLKRLKVLYRSPQRRNWWGNTRNWPVPELQEADLGGAQRWELAVPPNLDLVGWPVDVRLSETPSPLNWTNRLFGPLGRSAEEPVFNPLAWGAWQLSSPPNSAAQSSTFPEFPDWLRAPQGWRQFSFIHPQPGQRLQVTALDRVRWRLLSWILLLTALGLTILIRRLVPQRWSRMVIVTAIITCGAGWLSPATWSMLFGGFTAGLLLGGLLPWPDWWPQFRTVPPDQIPPGSTQSFRLSAAVKGALILFVCGWGHWVAWGADALPPLTGEVLLVPVDESLAPSSQLPLVYLSQPLADRLEKLVRSRQSRAEVQLISARYRVRLTSPDTVLVTCQLLAFVPTLTDNPRLKIPIPTTRLQGRQGCLVNGQTQPVTPEDGGLVIPLGADSSGELDNLREIDLEFRIPINRLLGGATAAVQIPVCHKSQLVLQTENDPRRVEIIGAFGETQSALDQQTVQSELGPTNSFTISWPATESNPLPQVPMTQSWLLDAQSMAWEAQGQLQGEAIGGPLRQLVVEFPAPWVLREVKSETPVRATSRLTETGRRVTIDFTPPVTGRFAVQLLAAACNTSTGELRLIPPELSSPDRALIPAAQTTVGVAVAPEFKLTSSQPLDSTLTTLDRFAADFPLFGSRVRPAGVTTIAAQSALDLRVEPQVPSRRVTDWTQVGRLALRRWDWTWNGQLDVAAGSAYQHIIQIDPRLRVESISVQENGIERLQRWTRLRQNGATHRLVLFLSDSSVGRQTITLRTSMSVPAGQPTSFPLARLEETEVVAARLVLYHDSAAVSEVEPIRGLTGLEKAPEWPDLLEGFHYTGRYRIDNPDWSASAVLTPQVGKASWSTAIYASLSAQGTALVGEALVIPSDPSSVRVELTVPETLRATWEASVVPPTIPMEFNRSTGLLRVNCRGDDGGATSFRLKWTANRSNSTKVDTLDLPQLSAATEVNEWVAVSSDENWQIDTAAVQHNQQPDWATAALADWLPSGTPIQWYQAGNKPLQVRRDTVAGIPIPAELIWAEHSLWLTTNGEQLGRTAFLVRGRSKQVRFLFPAEIHPTGLIENGTEMALPPFSDGEMIWSPASNEDVICIFVEWRSRSTRLGWRPQQIACNFPQLDLPGTNSAWVSIVSAEGDNLWVSDGGNGRRWTRLALDRLGLLTSQIQQTGDAVPSWLPEGFLISYRHMTSRLAHGLRVGDDLLTPEETVEWGRIVESINRGDWFSRILASESPPRIDWPADISNQESHIWIGQLSDTSQPLRGWRWPQQAWGQTALILLMGLLVVVALRVPKLATTLSARHAMSLGWATLGLIWWLVLTPSLAGFALLAFGLWQWRISRNEQGRSKVSTATASQHPVVREARIAPGTGS